MFGGSVMFDGVQGRQMDMVKRGIVGFRQYSLTSRLRAVFSHHLTKSRNLLKHGLSFYIRTNLRSSPSDLSTKADPIKS